MRFDTSDCFNPIGDVLDCTVDRLGGEAPIGVKNGKFLFQVGPHIRFTLRWAEESESPERHIATAPRSSNHTDLGASACPCRNLEIWKMNVRSRIRRQKPQRSGFTLIELLVVISIIAVLASLILPGVQNAREAARRTQCLNNQRNIGTAIQNYASANRGQLPPLTGDFTINFGDGSTSDSRPAPWSVHILPYMEQVGLYDRIQNSNNATPGPNSTNGLATVSIESFVCPNDPNGDAPGGKTYVVNGGYIPTTRWLSGGSSGHSIVRSDGTPRYAWQNFPEPREQMRATAASGVFWRTGVGVDLTGGIRVTLDQVSGNDGLSQTIFMTENLSTRPFDSTTTVGGWISTLTNDIAFGFPVEDDEEVDDPQPIVDALVTSIGHPQGRINQNLEATGGTRPRPSSYHPGVVVVTFGDNSVRTLNQNMDVSVYARLITPNGNRYGQNILSSSDF